VSLRRENAGRGTTSRRPRRGASQPGFDRLGLPSHGTPEPTEFVRLLLDWHKGRERSFPWRQAGSPFAVLLAEVMLQRTQAPQAARIYSEFLARFPDPEAVVGADPDEVTKSLAGLGLQHRGQRVVHLCRALVERHGGRVPDDRMALRALPGVGPYTEGAVLCFGFGQDVAIVDENVVRVLCRVFGYVPKAARPRTDRGLWALAQSLVPYGHGREYNFALLDFAAVVCRDTPRHELCPLKDFCCGFRALRSEPEDDVAHPPTDRTKAL
jgi:A/G-specific adenine glycosylase